MDASPTAPTRILCSLLLILVSGFLEPGFGQQQQVRPKKIIAGEEAEPGEFPFMVALVDRFLLDVFESRFLAQFCGATLIRPGWAVTAAHCVESPLTGKPFRPDELLALIGTSDLEAIDGELLEIAEIIVHPDFESRQDTLTNAIALLRLHHGIADPYVPVVRLPDDPRQEPGVDATVAGWGATVFDSETGPDEFPDKLQRTTVPILDSAECQSSYQDPLDDSHLCTTASPLNGPASCFGDSGGPLLVPDGENGWIQAGIVSFGSAEGCSLEVFDVYTRLSSFAEWISRSIEREIHFAQFANGSGISSQIVVVNFSSKAGLKGTIEIWDEGGEPLEVGDVLTQETAVHEFELPPLGNVVFSSTGEGPLVLGSVVIKTDLPAAGILRFTIPSIGVAGVGAGLVGPAIVAPVRRVGTVNMGLAVRNTEQDTITVEFTLKDAAGIPVEGATAERQISAQGRVALFIDELFPDIDTAGFEGTICASTDDGRIAAVALELGAAGEFTTLPVAAVQ